MDNEEEQEEQEEPSPPEQPLPDWKESSIDKLPEEINEQAKKVYRDTFKVVKDFYDNSRMNLPLNLRDVKNAAGEMAAEIVRDPQILLQIAVLKAIDNYTFSHALHVAIYATTLGRFLRFSPKELQDLSLAGLLHDIGKVDIPPQIVNKPGKLTAAEFELMKEHVRYSFNRVYRFQGITKELLLAIGQHHERIDGSGYPKKLVGKQIHKWARLLAIADVYDAVTTNRVYREALLPHVGAEILMGSTGQLDPYYVKMFISNISFYPVGCKVMLNNDEAGQVIAHNKNTPLRPVVQITGKDGKGVRVLNLADSLTTFITHIIKD